MLKRPELSRKEIKILKYELKTRPSARPGSRKPKKWVQNASENESAIHIQEYHSTLLECWLALSKWRMAPLRALAQRFSGDDKTHPFRLFHRKTCHDSHSTRSCLFFKHSSLYRSQNSADSFMFSERHFLTLLNFSYFSSLLWYSLKLGFLGFKDNCINFFEP